MDPDAVHGPWSGAVDLPYALWTMRTYVETHGAPTDRWVEEHLPDRSLQQIWDGCVTGSLLRWIVVATSMPCRHEVVVLEVEADRDHFAAFGERAISERFQVLADEAAVPTADLDPILDAANRLAIDGLRALRERFPRPAGPDLILARIQGKTIDNPCAKVEAAEGDRDRRLADAIRKLVPVAPTLEALVQAFPPPGPRATTR